MAKQLNQKCGIMRTADSGGVQDDDRRWWWGGSVKDTQPPKSYSYGSGKRCGTIKIWKRICREMRTEVIEIWHGKRRWRHQIHGLVDKNSGEERGYYEYGKMKAAPEMQE